jgi:hypothetical protein
VDRWCDLVSRLQDLLPNDRDHALSRLAELTASGELHEAARPALWRCVDATVRKHRAFADAPWALPEEAVDRLSSIAAALAPLDPIETNRWLFDEHLPDLGGLRGDVSTRMSHAERARVIAARAVLDAAGIDGLLALAEVVKYPGMLGYAAASHGCDALDARTAGLLDDDEPYLATFARAYVSARALTEGWPWLDVQLEKARDRPVAQARLLLESNDLELAWQKAVNLGDDVNAAYWREFSTLGRGPAFALVNRAAERLLAHDRPLAAVDLLSMYAEPGTSLVSPDLALKSLEQLLHLPAGHNEPTQISDYELERLMEYAQRTGADETQLAQLEWGLLPAMGYQAHSPILHRRLANDPAFFVEIVSLVYKAKGAESAGNMSPELATNAYRLLNEWRIVPGSSEPGGEINEALLRTWVDSAQQLLTRADRRDVGEIQIGHVFAQARSDGDGSWPTLPVRNVIEAAASTHIEQGLATQTHNNRGVTSRAPLDGGEQERRLAKHYDDLAARIRDEWPRTAAVLSSIARGYETEAHWYDEEAERLRRGMSR